MKADMSSQQMNFQLLGKFLFLLFSFLFLWPTTSYAQGYWTGEEEGTMTIWYVERDQIDKTFIKGTSPILWSYRAFVRLGVRWDGDPTLKLLGRFRREHEPWGRWEELEETWHEGIAHNSQIDMPQKSRYYMQLRFVGKGKIYYVAAETIIYVGPYGYLTVDDDPKPTPRKESSPKNYHPISLIAGLYHPRSEWKAAPTRCSYLNTTKTKMAIHHTVSPNNDTVPVETRIRQFQRYHQKTKGWCDIGYHFLVSADGRLWEGRPRKFLGAHVRNHNLNNLGISFIGTFMTYTPVKTMLCAGSKMIGWAAKTYKIPLDRQRIKGHREHSGAQTTCPGDKLLAKISTMISWAKTGQCNSVTPTTGTIQGVVFDAKDPSMKTRISGATVTLSNGKKTTTNSLGAFTFVVPAGTYKETASKTGYKTNTRSVTVIANKTIWASIGLHKQQTSTDTTPPKLTILQPKNNSVVSQPSVIVEGIATDETALDKVLVAHQPVGVDTQGHFRTATPLQQGLQGILIEAFDKAGNKTTKNIQITYQPVTTEKTKESPHSEPIQQIEKTTPDAGSSSPEPASQPETEPKIVPEKTISEQKQSQNPPDNANQGDQLIVLKECSKDKDCSKGETCIKGKCQKVPPRKAGCGCQEKAPTNSTIPLLLLLLPLFFLLLHSHRRRSS